MLPASHGSGARIGLPTAQACRVTWVPLRVAIAFSGTLTFVGLGLEHFTDFGLETIFLQVAGRVTGFFNWHWDSLHTVCLDTSGFRLTQNWWWHFTGDWRW